MLHRTAFGLAIMVLLFGSCFAPDVCPCGQSFDRDPFDPEAELAFGVDHQAGDHCWCRCGADGEPERMAPALDCSGFETACVSADGAPGVYRCD